MTDQGYVDFIDMRLNDPVLQSNDGRPRRVDPGTYEFEVHEIKMDTSQKGNPMLVVDFFVQTEGPMKGRMMRQYYPIMPDNVFARERMKTLVVDACGVPQDGLGRFAPQSLIGCHIVGDVIPQSYKALNAKGLPEDREGTKLVSERPVAQPAPTPQVQPTTQPRQGVVARRAPAAAAAAAAPPAAQPSGNGQGQIRR
jgi:hypothetical protein